jgi:hypothetical protein
MFSFRQEREHGGQTTGSERCCCVDEDVLFNHQSEIEDRKFISLTMTDA